MAGILSRGAVVHALRLPLQRQRRFLYQYASEPTPAENLSYGIHGAVNSAHVFAAPATETRLNIISVDFAQSCGLQITPSSHACTLADGSKLTSLGTASGLWEFPDEAPAGNVDFLVIPTSSSPVVLGWDFLSHTGILTSQWKRVEGQRASEGDAILNLLVVDPVPVVIAGSIRGDPVFAIPATGCEGNIISEKYLRMRGLSHLVNREAAQKVRLADERIVETSGSINLMWRFGNQRFWQSWPVEFSVMEDCLHDVVLGRPFLQASRAFTQYENFFQISDAAMRRIKFWAGVSFVPHFLSAFDRRQDVPAATDSAGDPSKFAELNRRAYFINENSNRSPSERVAALETEQRRIERWKAEHAPAGTSRADHVPDEEPVTIANEVTRGRPMLGAEHPNPRSGGEHLRPWRSYDSDRSSSVSRSEVDHED